MAGENLSGDDREGSLGVLHWKPQSGMNCAAGSPVIESANPWICMSAEKNSLNAGGNTDANRSP